mmetsp:Transcript_5014/g.20573  ORF Transcript_5014/g.20573 Transcript_5014/m.20573 type:complete len:295 (-) Transcript_5014:650-1534(-)
MDDVALLLRECTARSLVLVDELGRGTSATEAAAIGAALLAEFGDRGYTLILTPLGRPWDPTPPSSVFFWYTPRYRGVFATHLQHELLPLLPHEDETSTAAVVHPRWRMRLDSFALEAGVCDDAQALACARRAGVPASVLDRAAAFLGAPEAPATAAGEPRLEGDALEAQLRYELEAAHQASRGPTPRLAASSGLVRVPRGFEPPPALAATSCVYALHFADDAVYVGETDAIRDRLARHRKKGPRWRAAHALVVPVGDKSVARRVETLVIRALKSRGVTLESVVDGDRHVPPPRL